MHISDILRYKGSTVVTTSPHGTVAKLLDELADHNVGALVVLDAGKVVGIVSERDIVRKLQEKGSDILAGSVADIMTSPVVSCRTTDVVDEVAVTMTERRIRHMPVLDGGKLAGIVTIGDVVLSRMNQLEIDRVQLEQYING